MTVEELIEEKYQLQLKLMSLLKEFEEKTEVDVVDVTFDKRHGNIIMLISIDL